jgi:uncharacterized protein (DUF1800 family)
MTSDADRWAPYEPTPDDPWDLRKVAHLHRRAGFGATWSELQRDLPAGPAASIDRLLHPESEPPEFRRVADALKQAAGGSREAFSNEGDVRAAGAWWLYRMAYGADPLGEKLTLFWHNHFATGLQGVYSLQLMLDQNETLRRLARGRFGDLLTAIESDPAMLVWLDGGANHKDHPNENFARELLELFTLGVGNYDETDVRETARALTGWRAGRDNLLNRTNEFSYIEELADQTPKTILGQTGPWRRKDVFRIILGQPAAAEHICRRLYRAFVSEIAPPDEALIQSLATELRASNYSIEHVVGVMLRSRHFFSPAAYRARVKSPIEFCVGAIRQLEPRRTPNLLLLAAISCEDEGQKLFDPPSVKGWEGGRAWLNSHGALVRMNWVADFLGGNQQAGLPPYDPQAWLEAHAIASDAAVHRFADLLLQENAIQTLSSRPGNAAAAGPRNRVTAALQMLLESPDYQLA